MLTGSTRRLIWLTDIHLEFLTLDQIGEFYDTLASAEPDAILITGDIAVSHVVGALLQMMIQQLKKPVYFVLGNHDFYYGDIEPVRDEMTALTKKAGGAVWMPAAGVVELTPDTALVGHDGWADGRYGDYLRSPILLNDYDKIESLKIVNTAERLAKLNALGDQAGDYLRGILPEAARRYPNVFVLIHPPPFQEACWYEGRTPADDNPYLPHFACKAAGDALLTTAADYPDVTFTVLCGHVHHSGTATIRPNLTVITGGAEYNKPQIQRVFTLPLTGA